MKCALIRNNQYQKTYQELKNSSNKSSIKEFNQGNLIDQMSLEIDDLNKQIKENAKIHQVKMNEVTKQFELEND